ncbi:MAG TPA: hypothetical protein VMI72_14505 [Roseiarcus sp.]|nr:hypothetical protein [Roseiarcus sp.]
MRAFVGGWAEIHLVRARLLALSGDLAAAEDRLSQSIAVARALEARFLELLAAMELARLWDKRRERVEAAQLLAPIYGWFREGLETSVLRTAEALLEQVA